MSRTSIGLVTAVLLFGAGAFLLRTVRLGNAPVKKSDTHQSGVLHEQTSAASVPSLKKDITALYVEPGNAVSIAAARLRAAGRTQEATQLELAASQPMAIWLSGPNQSDPTAQSDIQKVRQSSADAQSKNMTVVYQLYAIPKRDACAGFSGGGFTNSNDYLTWVRQIVENLSAQSIILLETDAIAHIVNGSCLNSTEINERYSLLSQSVDILKASAHVKGVYLDGGHSEWFPDPSVLVEPLKKSGVVRADGVSVNVAYFVATADIVSWSQKLVQQISATAGVVIDTSRNGNGVVDASIKGESRWCNPAGRHVGQKPTLQTGQDRIHAYLWVKTIGQSDGACRGYPQAGEFVDSIALELTSPN